MIPIKILQYLKYGDKTEKKREYSPTPPFTFGELHTDPEVYLDYGYLFVLIACGLLSLYILMFI